MDSEEDRPIAPRILDQGIWHHESSLPSHISLVLHLRRHDKADNRRSHANESSSAVINDHELFIVGTCRSSMLNDQS